MQDNFVFSDTVERNIVLGATTDRDRLADAIDIACLDGYVASRPMGGGHHARLGRQRTQRRRAAARDDGPCGLQASPYIMLDEATSSLDAETEHRITTNVGRNSEARQGW